MASIATIKSSENHRIHTRVLNIPRKGFVVAYPNADKVIAIILISKANVKTANRGVKENCSFNNVISLYSLYQQ